MTSNVYGTHQTVLVRRSYHAAFSPENHPNQYVVFFLSVVDVQRAGWKLHVQASGQRRHHLQWLG
jgi:hypothetical protein